MTTHLLPTPGLIILFGSGETSPSGRKMFDRLLRLLPPSPNIALLETPAGFELNSDQVIRRVGDFMLHNLQNYSPKVDIIAARKRGTPFSPDAPEIVAPLLKADMIFMGPGSPSYAIRQLHNSLAWNYLVARHFLGACLAFASAAAIAISARALPVYEIYKAGEDIHWIEGLDFFNFFGLKLVFIPHWNNHEGGDQLDTSRCFMGRERFARLVEILPEEMTIVGLDEKTALILDPSKSECQVSGLGKITLILAGQEYSHRSFSQPAACNESNISNSDHDLLEISDKCSRCIQTYQAGQSFPMSVLGQVHPYQPETSLPAAIWQKAMDEWEFSKRDTPTIPPDEVNRLIQERETARHCRNWSVADELREQIAKLGWEVMDTMDGPIIKKLVRQQN